MADLFADEDGERATLVEEAYETEDHRIILCEDDNERVYHHGAPRLGR